MKSSVLAWIQAAAEDLVSYLKGNQALEMSSSFIILQRIFMKQ